MSTTNLHQCNETTNCGLLKVGFGPALKPFPVALPESLELYLVLKCLKIPFVELNTDMCDMIVPRFPYILTCNNNIDNKIYGTENIYKYICDNNPQIDKLFFNESCEKKLLAQHLKHTLWPVISYYFWKIDANYNESVYPHLKYKGLFAFKIVSAYYLRYYMLNEHNNFLENQILQKELNRSIETIFGQMNTLIRSHNHFSMNQDTLTILDLRLYSYIVFFKYIKVKNFSMELYFMGVPHLLSHFSFMDKTLGPYIVENEKIQNNTTNSEKKSKFIITAFTLASLLLVYLSKY